MRTSAHAWARPWPADRAGAALALPNQAAGVDRPRTINLAIDHRRAVVKYVGDALSRRNAQKCNASSSDKVSAASVIDAFHSAPSFESTVMTLLSRTHRMLGSMLGLAKFNWQYITDGTIVSV